MKLLSGIFVAAVSGKTINRENRTVRSNTFLYFLEKDTWSGSFPRIYKNHKI